MYLPHIVTFAICAVLLLYCAVAIHALSMRNLGMSPSAIAIAVPLLMAPSFVLAGYWHERGNIDKREAALTFPWLIVLMVVIPLVVVVSAHLGAQLTDPLFQRMDERLGFNVPAIMAWASRHPHIQQILGRSYSLLFWLLATASLLPPLMGKLKAAQEFLLANAFVFLLAIPLFAVFPAIGPWVGYHFAANSAQQACEASIRALHQSVHPDGVKVFGIVCFPSFHVIWAVLSAMALWSIRWLRLPAFVLAALIVISTLTTGWHYGVDVLGGLLLCTIAVMGARWIVRMASTQQTN